LTSSSNLKQSLKYQLRTRSVSWSIPSSRISTKYRNLSTIEARLEQYLMKNGSMRFLKSLRTKLSLSILNFITNTHSLKERSFRNSKKSSQTPHSESLTPWTQNNIAQSSSLIQSLKLMKTMTISLSHI
jgi:hypothetical protein